MLDLMGKHYPVIFSAVLLLLFFFLRNNACKIAGFPEPALVANVHFADSIVWKNKSFVWNAHRQENKCVFAYVIFWKTKQKPMN